MKHPLEEEEWLLNLRRSTAAHSEERDEVNRQLVELYVRHGEFFKMNTKPEPVLAERYLKKALQIEKNHPIANYRYAHILYRQKRYLEALNHFHRAIDGSVTDILSETHMKLARMFCVNCGIFLAKEALVELEEEAGVGEGTLDHDLINKYQTEILAGSELTFDKMFYHLKTMEFEEIISESTYFSLIEAENLDRVILGRNEDGFFLVHNGRSISGFEERTYRILRFILTSREYKTNEQILEEVRKSLFNKRDEEEIQDENDNNFQEEAVRQAISRLKRRIPFLSELMDEARVGTESNRRIGRRLRPEYSYCELYRADYIFE